MALRPDDRVLLAVVLAKLAELGVLEVRIDRADIANICDSELRVFEDPARAQLILRLKPAVASLSLSPEPD